VIRKILTSFFATIFVNYFVMMLTIGVTQSFIDFKKLGYDNALPLYLIEFPLTFILMLWLMRKRNDDES
jgi:hypothetical protein